MKGKNQGDRARSDNPWMSIHREKFELGDHVARSVVSCLRASNDDDASRPARSHAEGHSVMDVSTRANGAGHRNRMRETSLMTRSDTHTHEIDARMQELWRFRRIFRATQSWLCTKSHAVETTYGISGGLCEIGKRRALSYPSLDLQLSINRLNDETFCAKPVQPSAAWDGIHL
jgi:hypothetical protein